MIARGICETNGVRIHYLRTGGAKPPVVLLHGLMGSGACWTLLARALEGEFDVIMPDARGHGGSSKPRSGYRYDDHASDVIGLVRALDLSRPVLVGHSMGGMTAAVATTRAADIVRGLVLVDPTFLGPERQREVSDSDVADQHRVALGLSKQELVAQARQRHPHRSLEIIELQAEARLNTSIDAFDVLTPPNPDYRELVCALAVPTLLVIGDTSPVVTLDMAAELHVLNPRIRVEQVRDAGHGLPFEQPERLNEVVRSFLNGGN
ncbi:MAG TPA: alpha/beta hydrolase [Kofleriaceae bacterium]|nr:alpha/beta hydrolase [Kofleriaceae bacterium]